jgi:hypothetical protein
LAIIQAFNIDSGIAVGDVNVINTQGEFTGYFYGANTYNVTSNGTSSFLFNGVDNPTLSLVRGFTYRFAVTSTGDPLWIKTDQSDGSANAYANVINNGTDAGTITFPVPFNAPDTLYYKSQNHSSMAGTIYVKDVGAAGPVLQVTGTDASISNSTGALTVVGGTGIGGNLNVGGANSVFSGNVTVGKVLTANILVANTLTISDNVSFSKTLTVNSLSANTITSNIISSNVVSANAITANSLSLLRGISANSITIGNTSINSDNISIGSTYIASGNISIGNTYVTAGNISVGNTFLTSSRISANAVYSDRYFYANGVAFVSGSSSSNVFDILTANTITVSNNIALSVNGNISIGGTIIDSTGLTVGSSFLNDGYLSFGAVYLNTMGLYGEVSIGNTSVKAGNVSVGNTSITSSVIRTSNVSVGNTTITSGNISIGGMTITSAGISSTGNTSTIGLGNTSITSDNVSVGNTSVTAGNVSVGNTFVTSGGVSVGNTSIVSGNVSVGNTYITAGTVAVGNTSITSGNVSVGNTYITAGNVSVGNTKITSTAITANAIYAAYYFDANGNVFTSGTSGAATNAFTRFVVTGQSSANDVIAKSNSSVLTFSAGPGIALTSNGVSNTITISSANTIPVLTQSFVANGSQTTFTLNGYVLATDILVLVDTVPQQPLTNYYVNGLNLTFDAAPANGSIIDVRTFGNSSAGNGYTSFTGNVYTDKVFSSSFYGSNYYYYDGTPFTSGGNSFVNFAVAGQSTLTARSNNGTLSLVPGTGITISTNSSANSITISSTATGNAFTNFAVSGQSTVTPTSNNATLSFVAGSGISIGTNPLAGTITFTSTGTGGGGGGSGTYGTLYGTNDVLIGTGSQTAFTITSSNTSANDMIVTVDSVIQTPTTNYTVFGNTVTFTEAPLAGAAIEVRTFTTGSVYTGDNVTSFSANTAFISNVVSSIYTSAVPVSTSATVIDQFEPSKYRTAKYIISTTNGTQYQASEAMIVHDGTTPYIVTYATVYTGASKLINFTSSIAFGNVLLQGTSVSGTSNVKIQKTYIGI